MQIQCAKVERTFIDDSREEVKADLLLNDTGVLVRDVIVSWHKPSGMGTVKLPNDWITFYNPCYERAFAALAVQAVVVVLIQQEQAATEPSRASPDRTVNTFTLPGWVN
jgi:hypothetical protein